MPSGAQKISKKAAEHLAKNRHRCEKFPLRNCCIGCKVEPYHEGYTCKKFKAYKEASKCRFCGDVEEEGYRCGKDECKKLRKTACTKTKDCGHPCGGYKKETVCLPCLQPECIRAYNSDKDDGDKLFDGQTADDFCICMITALSDEPSVMLGCRHIQHVACVQQQVNRESARLIFNHLNCKQCNQRIKVPQISKIANQIEEEEELETKMKKEKKKQIKADKKDKAGKKGEEAELQNPDKMLFYLCKDCNKPYFAGMDDCINELKEPHPDDLICLHCVRDRFGDDAEKCDHKIEEMLYKCRFCCNPSNWLCQGVHFCERCHLGQVSGLRLVGMKPSKLPWGKCSKKDCQIGGDHKPAGEEDLIGCGLCIIDRGGEIRTIQETEKEMAVRKARQKKTDQANNLFN